MSTSTDLTPTDLPTPAQKRADRRAAVLASRVGPTFDQWAGLLVDRADLAEEVATLRRAVLSWHALADRKAAVADSCAHNANRLTDQVETLTRSLSNLSDDYQRTQRNLTWWVNRANDLVAECRDLERSRNAALVDADQWRSTVARRDRVALTGSPT